MFATLRASKRGSKGTPVAEHMYSNFSDYDYHRECSLHNELVLRSWTRDPFLEFWVLLFVLPLDRIHGLFCATKNETGILRNFCHVYVH